MKDVNKFKRMEYCLKVLFDGDDFVDVIFFDECLVNIERSIRRFFYKVGEFRRFKGKLKYSFKVSLYFSSFSCIFVYCRVSFLVLV